MIIIVVIMIVVMSEIILEKMFIFFGFFVGYLLILDFSLECRMFVLIGWC